MTMNRLPLAALLIALSPSAWAQQDQDFNRLLEDAVRKTDAQFRTEFSGRIEELTSVPEAIKPRRPAAAAHELDKAKRAHKTTWSTLLFLDQIDEVFSRSGEIRVRDLPVWQEQRLGSKAVRMAEMMDGIFVRVRGAQRLREDSGAVLARLLETGRAEGRNLRWLADGISGLYKFYGSDGEAR